MMGKSTIMIQKTVLLLFSAILCTGCSSQLIDNPDSLLSLIGLTMPGSGLYAVSTDPPPGSTDVPPSTPIKAVFSRDINFTTITDKSFVVADNQFVPVNGTYSYDATIRTVTFVPSASLANLTEYNVLITTDVTDLNGTRMIREKTWRFTTMPVPGTVASPIFTPAPGTYEGTQHITISCPDPNATIRYTLDGSPPTNSHGTVYTTPLSIKVNTVNPIQAIAYRAGYTDSTVTAASYNIEVMTPAITPPPGLYNTSQSLMISTGTTVALTSIKYTDDGTDPASSVTAHDYTVPFTISAPSTTIQAVAMNPLMMNSPILTAVYIINTAQVAPPVFSPLPGSYTFPFSITLSTTTTGATIKYTTDGSDPSPTNGIEGTSVYVADTLILKAYAYKTGMLDSTITNSAGDPYIIAPRVISMLPNKGPNIAPVQVIINGKHFKAGAGALLQLSGQPNITATSVTVVNSTTISCTFDITGAMAAKWDVVVANTDGGYSTNVKFFRIY